MTACLKKNQLSLVYHYIMHLITITQKIIADQVSGSPTKRYGSPFSSKTFGSETQLILERQREV